jgi:hypothetical protein
MNPSGTPYVCGEERTVASPETVERIATEKRQGRAVLEPGQVVTLRTPSDGKVDVAVVEGWDTQLYGMVYRVRLPDGRIVKVTGERLSARKSRRHV